MKKMFLMIGCLFVTSALMSMDRGIQSMSPNKVRAISANAEQYGAGLRELLAITSQITSAEAKLLTLEFGDIEVNAVVNSPRRLVAGEKARLQKTLLSLTVQKNILLNNCKANSTK